MYPFEELFIEELEGEIWKDVRDFEGYYKVSNLGRVKSLDRIVPHKRCGTQFVKGQILKQRAVKFLNHYRGDFMISLETTLNLESVISQLAVKRLVYSAFVKPIDFEKDGMYVINKDGDGYNNRLANLELIPKSQKQLRSIQKGRVELGTSNSLPVNQYTLAGKLVKKYKSVLEANRITGFYALGIGQAAKGLNKRICCGFKWKFELKKQKKKPLAYKELDRFIIKYPYQQVIIENLEGEIWKDVPDFEGYYKVSNLGRVKSVDREVPNKRYGTQILQGKILRQKTAKDFNHLTNEPMITLRVTFTIEGAPHYFNTRRLVYATFIKKCDFAKDGLYVINIDGDGYNNRLSNLDLVSKSAKQIRSLKKGRSVFKPFDNTVKRIPVNQYSLKGKLIKKYKSITEAQLTTGFKRDGISFAARGIYKNYRGFIWQFSNKLE